MEPSFKFTLLHLPLFLIGLSSAINFNFHKNFRNLYSDESSDSSYPELWFDQKLDHHYFFDVRRFKQRYMVNDKYYQDDSDKRIIGFLYVGGAETISGEVMESNILTEFAKRFNGILFQLEHRYYGKSIPSQDDVSPIPSYLSAMQAIYDINDFIDVMSYDYSIDEWIVIGKGYGGSLATWLREYGTDLITGSVAVSAPLLAKVDFFEYFQLVEETIYNHNPTCYDQIGEAFFDLANKTQVPEERDELTRKFKLPEEVDKSILAGLKVISAISKTIFGDAVQYNRNNISGRSIDYYCNAMNNPDHESWENLVNILGEIITNGNSNNVNMKISSNDLNMRKFQMCNEFGYFATSSPNSIFGNNIPLEDFLEICKSFRFDYDYNSIFEKISETNYRFGGLYPYTSSNLISFQGGLDPWRVVELSKDFNDDTIIIKVEGASHGQLLEDPLPGEVEPEGLAEARERVYESVGYWLSKSTI